MALYNRSFSARGTREDDPAPEYHPTLTRSDSSTTGSSLSVNSSSLWHGQFEEPLPPSSAPSNAPRRGTPISRARPDRYQYTYNLIAGSAPLQFLISVEPSNGKPTSGKYTFRLSLKVGKTERPLGDPVTVNLSIDPKNLEFIVFIFPGKATVPQGCLYAYRVWLRANLVDHRIFGDDELWVGKDPDFELITDASFARLKSVTPNSQVYEGVVGRARVSFIAKWVHVAEGLYKYSLEYEAGGVGATLMDDFRLILQTDPRTVTFLIYTVPMTSVPVGASHRLRVWMKTLLPLVTNTSAISLPFNDSYIYQRIWKSDSFKVGSRLDFDSLGNKMIMGYANGPPKVFTMSQSRDKYEAKGSIELG